MWVARCKLINGTEIDKDLSPKFKTAQECSEYIHNNKDLLILEWLFNQVQNIIDFNIDRKWTIRFGSYIRPYNLQQKRFCDGFDF